jgi:outer membrane lipoprotein-sorting protein
MRRLFFVLLFVATAALELNAQNNQYNSAEDSDPEAVKLLSNIRKKYDAFTSLKAKFQLDIALPGQPVEKQAGVISRKGDNVRFVLGDQEGILNGEAAYIIMHRNKEVQINDLPDPEETTGVLTPQTLFNFYEGDQYVLAVQGTEKIGTRSLKIIELKPLDRDNSEFTKLRLLVDPTKKELVVVKAFSRDGTNFTFTLEETMGNVNLPANTFVFSKTDFPGYHVEDLRF